MSFQDLNLSPEILKALHGLGFATPTPIQLSAIPKILEGFDIRASAQTGTGKTAAFLLPALSRLSTPSPVRGKGPRVLILVPTRELAMQVAAEATRYSEFMSRCRTVCIYGGAPYPAQNKQLSQVFDILVATPGRLIDHMERGRIDFSRLELLVLDEADRMLDMGFIQPVEQIAFSTPQTRQTLLFSATMKGTVLNLSKRLLRNPIEIAVEEEHAKHENIEQRLHYVNNMGDKHRVLDELLAGTDIYQAIVFISTKHQADELLDRLLEEGHQAAVLHGDMNQRHRTKTIHQLREGEIRILVATDVAARGIDIPTISHVINFDLPRNVEDYVHRIGRTGRAGAKGIALSFVSGKDLRTVKQIQDFTGQEIVPMTIPGLDIQIDHFSSSNKNRGRFRSQRPYRESSRGPARPFEQRADSRGDSREGNSESYARRPRQDSPRNENTRSENTRSERDSSYTDRPQRSSRPPFRERSSFHETRAERPERSSFDRGSERPQRSERPERSSRPPFGENRSRPSRPPFGEGRAERSERPSRARPSYGEARTERPFREGGVKKAPFKKFKGSFTNPKATQSERREDVSKRYEKNKG